MGQVVLVDEDVVPVPPDDGQAVGFGSDQIRSVQLSFYSPNLLSFWSRWLGISRMTARATWYSAGFSAFTVFTKST